MENSDAGVISTWSKYVQLKGRYQRSVSIERDIGQHSWLAGYVLTGLGETLVRRIVGGLAPGGQRAWSVTGPYGSGKSAFAVFLCHLLGIDKQPADAARALLQATDRELASRLRGGSAYLRKGGLCPVIATGSRNSLEAVLVTALADAADSYWNKRGARPELLDELLAARRRADAGKAVSSREVVRLFERAAKKVSESNQDGEGLLVILDEAGKCLEYAADSPTGADVSVLQELAEASSRSSNAPIVFVVVLHQAFEQYANRLSAARRNEWAKIQGRFEDLPFQEEIDQLLKVVGKALQRQQLPRAAAASVSRVAATVSRLATKQRPDKRARLEELLSAAAPLHPITSLLLGPLFRSRLAQNERSLFAFLASAEPGGFQEFLMRPRDPAAPFLYGIDELYDYIIRSLGPRLFGHQGRQWSLIETALHRLPPDADHLHARVVKAIGMLSMLGESARLSADQETIAAALSLEGSHGRSRLSQVIAKLEKSSAIVYRKYKGAYQLWEGSDVDIEALTQEAYGQLQPQGPVAAVLERLAQPRPHLARRHFLETGTLRFFEVHYVDVAATIGPPSPRCSHADGFLYFLIPNESNEQDETKTNAVGSLRDPAGRPVIVAVPNNLTKIRELAADLAALEWVQANAGQILDDPVARRELSARLLEVQRLLRAEAQSYLEGTSRCSWHYKGRTFEMASSRALASWLSQICDKGYGRCPNIHNELLNRRNLSSAAAAARRNLMQAMIERPQDGQLGIEGHPPELSMYLSVLRDLGLHRISGSRPAFLPPEPSSKAAEVWEALKAALAERDGGKASLKDLYSILEAPPFGMKEGVLPVLLLAFVLSMQDELALYEDGTFVPSLTVAVIERWLRGADRFQIQHYRIAGERAPLLSRALQALTGGKGDHRFSVVLLTKHLVRFMRDLPDFSRNTRRISEQAQSVREAVLRAHEPGPLLFKALPHALGMAAFSEASPADEAKADQFIGALKTSLRELQVAYPTLLNSIERALSSAFGLCLTETRAELVSRSKRLLPTAVDPQLKGFLVRSSSDETDPENYLVSLATVLVGRPPSGWYDADLDQFRIAAALLARKFHSLESLAIAGAPEGSATDVQLLRLSVAQLGIPEKEKVIALRPSDQAALVGISVRLSDLLAQIRHENPDLVLAALALAAEGLLEHENGEALVDRANRTVRNAED